MITKTIKPRRSHTLLILLLPTALAVMAIPPACMAQDAWRAQEPEWTMTANKSLDAAREDRWWARKRGWFKSEARREQLREAYYRDDPHDRHDHRRDRRDDEDRDYGPRSDDPWVWDRETRRLLAMGEYGEAMRRAERQGAAYARNNKCHDRIVEATSLPHQTVKAAEAQAWKLWVRSINIERGAIWQNPNASMQRWKLCVIAEVGDTYLGGLSVTIGKAREMGRNAKDQMLGEVNGDDRELEKEARGHTIVCRLWARACPVLPQPLVLTPGERKDDARERREDRRERRR